MVHVQAAHMINIYELGHDTTNNIHINNNNNNIINDASSHIYGTKANESVVHDDTVPTNKVNADYVNDKPTNINQVDCAEDSRMLIVNTNNVSNFLFWKTMNDVDENGVENESNLLRCDDKKVESKKFATHTRQFSQCLL